MNDWFKKTFEKVKGLWAKWSLVQKIIFFSVVGAALAGLILLGVSSSTPNMVPLFSSPITDQELLGKISFRLDEERVEHRITEDGRILLKDKLTSVRMVSLLAREDLIPSGTSPWDAFKMDRWTVTDFERKVQLRQAITQNLKQHIEALEDVDRAVVEIVMPEESLFAEDQDPVTVALTITPRPGSGLATDTKKIQGIERLVQLAVQGLQSTDIVITDNHGIILNDFEDMADFTRMALADQQLKQKSRLEKEYQKAILAGLKRIYTEDRIGLVRVDVDLDHRQESMTSKEFYPITVREDDPNTPYSELETINHVLRSTHVADEEFQGTGFHPQGPPGLEGQAPPDYQDLDNMNGYYRNNSKVENFEINERNTQKTERPWDIRKVTVGVAIDGVWNKIYNDKGTIEINKNGSIVREYVPVSDEELNKAKDLVEHSVGFSAQRGDSVTVQHLTFDRSAQFEQEDQVYRNRLRNQKMLVYSILGLLALGVIALAARLIIRERERRRRLREEELARQHQAMREAALRSAEEENVDINISVEEKARMEMQEHAKNLAREHPEDVAQLIRTWLAEE